MSLVLFEVAGVSAAVAAADVLEVVALRYPTPVPAGPGFLVGLIAHRGAVVPLVDGAERLAGAPAHGPLAPAALLLTTSVGPVALTIDRVLDVARGVDEVSGVKVLDVESLVRECRELIGAAARPGHEEA